MSRLFLRFYVGILLVLFAAWVIQVWVTPDPTSPQNAPVIESAFAGGMRLSADRYDLAAPEERPEILRLIKARHEIPVQLVPAIEVPLNIRQRFSRREDIALFSASDGLYLIAALSDPDQVLMFGPLPGLIGPTRWGVTVGFAIVLAVAAGAIFVLLRPIWRQLQLLERAATSISKGNLDVRIETDQAGPLRDVASAINGLAEQTQSLLRTQQELMQAVSHELKTPLSRIQFAVELLESEVDPERIQSRLEVMRTAADELDEMVGRLLLYVRSETPKSVAPNWRVPLEPIVNEVFSGESLLHPQLSYELDKKLVDEDICVLSNATDLTCVVSNAVRNAGRFAATKIRVSAYRTSKGIVLDIDDDGPGIAPNLRKKIFRPFERLSDDGGSAGLGLALIARIMAKHGGWVKAESSPEGGCRIRTFWPKSANGSS